LEQLLYVFVVLTNHNSALIRKKADGEAQVTRIIPI
jgi:hypothetical protein